MFCGVEICTVSPIGHKAEVLMGPYLQRCAYWYFNKEIPLGRVLGNHVRILFLLSIGCAEIVLVVFKEVFCFNTFISRLEFCSDAIHNWLPAPYPD